MADDQTPAAAPPTRSSLQYLWVVFAVIGVGLLLWGLQPKSSTSAPRQTAPDFTLPTADGTTVTLSALKGKPVFINFWATWCAPCLHELPLLSKLQQEYKDEVQFLFVSIDDDWEPVNRYLKAAALDIPVVLDPIGKQVAMGLFNASAWPTTITLDKDLGIVHKVEGSLDEARARRLIAEALGQNTDDGTTAPR